MNGNGLIAVAVIVAFTGNMIIAQTETKNPNFPFWRTIGNANTNPTVNFIGTTDAADWVIRTNNTERARVLSTGNVGIGTATPANRLTVNHAGTSAATATTYPLALALNNNVDFTAGSDASYAYLQSWNSKPLLLNSQGNFVGIGITTAPIQTLDINGRLNVRSGVIQRGTTQINVTSDLGLYSQLSGNWIRIATNAAPIKFFLDQGGGNSAGTNAIVNIDNASGGGVAIGANLTGATDPTPYNRALLDLQSTDKGFLLPRLTTAQRDAMGINLTEGLMIYNITNDCIEFWDTKYAQPGGNGFWNNLCRHCEETYVYTASNNGNNFHVQAGSPSIPRRWCVYVNTGVTLGASAPGGVALSFSGLPAGSEVVLYNSGTIIGGGGNGGHGAQESDALCMSDGNAGDGQAGGAAILSSPTVKVTVINMGVIGGGGGGGGGGSGGCRARGGGGGGGRGIPGGNGGAAPTVGGQKATGVTCTSCTSAGASANNGNPGNALAPGTGGCGTGNSGGGCLYSGYNGGCGGTGGDLGAAGSNGSGSTCGSLISSGGAFGLGGPGGPALNGNGGGCTLVNVSGGVSYGVVIP
ncbi:MAG: hypothetical protein NZM35_04670 [Chitinophagales bacterium]|nr:hypothetical protein [Chitinophagales bacterium]MDW8420041.1 hypothetical protein [Chitinophagales bacterium]